MQVTNPPHTYYTTSRLLTVTDRNPGFQITSLVNLYPVYRLARPRGTTPALAILYAFSSEPGCYTHIYVYLSLSLSFL